MTVAAGLLGYLASDLDPARIEEAQRRSPWRGTPGSTMVTPVGGIISLGSALAGQHRHLSVAIHGRIDNLPEFAQALDIDQSDVIALLGEAYLRFGDDFAGRLLGDFSILVLDERRGTLLGVRDWIGARPLYWGRHQGVIAFGSEVKQVLALLELPYVLDEETAAQYKRMDEPSISATFVKGIKALAPSGQVLASMYHDAHLSTRPVVFETLDVTMPEAADLIRDRINIAVERRLAGAGRPAALISGGMDSTSIAATASMLAKQGRVPPLVAGISLHFPNVPHSDEARYSSEVAELWNIPWYPVAIEPEDLARDPIELFRLHDGPVFPGIQMFDRMFAEARRHGADVLLAGLGGDFWMDQYFREVAFSLLRGEWRSALTWAAFYLRIRPRSVVKQVVEAALAFNRRDVESEHFASTGTRHWTIRVGYEVEERLGQYYGLNVVHPFVDRELAGVLVSLSPRLRSRPGVAKLPLRSAMADRLPKSVLTRYDKSFFDPVFADAFGKPPEGQSAAQMVADWYLSCWRQYLDRNCSTGRTL